MEKPPLGVPPHWFVYPKRIESLADAILQWVRYSIKYHGTRRTKEDYKLISNWAMEIAWLAELMAELED
ncbi:MAG: hypothetical protein Q4F81_05110 [Eubacteriales bacterium]|nr:hypothetical protein [Eubacteriales bacterium]